MGPPTAMTLSFSLGRWPLVESLWYVCSFSRYQKIIEIFFSLADVYPATAVFCSMRASAEQLLRTSSLE